MATMKLSSRGMIKIKMPAIRATMAGICAAVMTIRTPVMQVVMRGGIVRGRHSRVVSSELGDAGSAIEFPHSQKLPENAACGIAIFRNDAAQDALAPRARANQLACIMTRGAVRCETTYLPLQRLRQRYPRPRRHSRK